MQAISEGLSTSWAEVALTQLQLWLTVFTIDTLRYFIGVGLVSFVLFVWLRSWSKSRKIQSRQASKKDIKREITYSLITTGVYATIALFTVQALELGYMQVYEQVSVHGWLYTLLTLPILLVLHDTYFYWAHRLMHHKKLFRWVHKVHHLSRPPTPWAAYSFAPAEAFAMALFMPIMLWAIPLHGAVIFVFLSIMIVRNAMGHSGVEFHHQGWVDGPLDVFTTITHHDQHHQDFNGNFGLYFTWWDRLMGTELPCYKARFHEAARGNKPDAQASLIIQEEG